MKPKEKKSFSERSGPLCRVGAAIERGRKPERWAKKDDKKKKREMYEDVEGKERISRYSYSQQG